LIYETSIVRNVAHVLKSGPMFQYFPTNTDMGLIPSERASKIIRVDLRDHSFHRLGPEISWVKGGPGEQTGGCGIGQSGVPRSPGGECFTPHHLNDP